MTTMRDVAARAGVSTATVSAVINSTAFVTDELKTRVLEAIEELNYQPNVLAKFLRFNKTTSIGVIIQNIQNPFYPSLLKGIEDTAWSKQHLVYLCNSDDHPDREMSFVQSLLQRKVDGMIVATAGYGVPNPVLDVLQQENLPYILVNRYPDTTDSHVYVGMDNRFAGEMAARHLLTSGKSRLAVISGPDHFSTSVERVKGFVQAAKSYGIQVSDSFICNGNYTENGGYESVRRLYEQSTPAPDGLFCTNDLMAYGAIQYLIENGYTLPQDIRVIGCDNIPFSTYCRIPLSTIDYPKYEMGAIAVRMLIERIQDPNCRQHSVILPPQLIIRES